MPEPEPMNPSYPFQSLGPFATPHLSPNVPGALAVRCISKLRARATPLPCGIFFYIEAEKTKWHKTKYNINETHIPPEKRWKVGQAIHLYNFYSCFFFFLLHSTLLSILLVLKNNVTEPILWDTLC